MKKIKNKINRKYIIIISILVFIVISLLFLFNGKKYPENVENIFEWNKNLYIITFKNDFDFLENCTITTDMYYEIKNNEDDIRGKKLSYFIEKEDVFSIDIRESIKEGVDKGIFTYDMKYTDFLAITCGFNNTKELLKNTKVVLKKNQKSFSDKKE